jgi:hypothetical protein
LIRSSAAFLDSPLLLLLLLLLLAPHKGAGMSLGMKGALLSMTCEWIFM